MTPARAHNRDTVPLILTALLRPTIFRNFWKSTFDAPFFSNLAQILQSELAIYVKKIINKGGIVQLLKCLVAKAFFSLPCFSVHQLQFQFLSLLSLSLFATPGARLSLFAGIPSKLHARSKYRNLRASDTLTNPRFYQYLTHALSPCTSESGLLACEQALYLGDTVKSHGVRASEGNETTVESRLLLWTPA